MKKLYVGCSLLHAPETFRSSVANIKDTLRREFEVLEFIPVTEGTPSLVYKNDIHVQVAICDLFLAVCDYPSLGLGYEMGVAIEKYGKPTLGIAQSDSSVSRLIQGIEVPHFKFRRYSQMSEVPTLLKEFTMQLI